MCLAMRGDLGKNTAHMNATQIRQVLEETGVSPSKSLGQNFLVDENIARWIVSQLEISPTDCVVEVGPGTGALTEHMAPLCRKLILVEFDARLAEYQPAAGQIPRMWRCTMRMARAGIRVRSLPSSRSSLWAICRILSAVRFWRIF